MTKARDVVIPRSKLTAHMPPGAATPRYGTYERVGPRGDVAKGQIDAIAGKPLPPASGSGRGWTLVSPAHHEEK